MAQASPSKRAAGGATPAMGAKGPGDKDSEDARWTMDVGDNEDSDDARGVSQVVDEVRPAT